MGDDSTEFWQQYDIYLEPGPHRVTWEFQYNPSNLGEPGSQGVAFLDSVYFVRGATLSPSGSPTAIPTFLATDPTISPESLPQ